jgi:hypothetical protein
VAVENFMAFRLVRAAASVAAAAAVGLLGGVAAAALAAATKGTAIFGASARCSS